MAGGLSTARGPVLAGRRAAVLTARPRGILPSGLRVPYIRSTTRASKFICPPPTRPRHSSEVEYPGVVGDMVRSAQRHKARAAGTRVRQPRTVDPLLTIAPTGNWSQPVQRFRLVEDVFGSRAFATGCHRLQPLCSTDAPSAVARSSFYVALQCGFAPRGTGSASLSTYVSWENMSFPLAVVCGTSCRTSSSAAARRRTGASSFSPAPSSGVPGGTEWLVSHYRFSNRTSGV